MYINIQFTLDRATLIMYATGRPSNVHTFTSKPHGEEPFLQGNLSSEKAFYLCSKSHPRTLLRVSCAPVRTYFCAGSPINSFPPYSRHHMKKRNEKSLAQSTPWPSNPQKKYKRGSLTLKGRSSRPQMVSGWIQRYVCGIA